MYIVTSFFTNKRKGLVEPTYHWGILYIFVAIITWTILKSLSASTRCDEQSQVGYWNGSQRRRFSVSFVRRSL